MKKDEDMYDIRCMMYESLITDIVFCFRKVVHRTANI